MTKRWLWSACALVLGGAALASANGVAAQECDTDAECGAGMICKSYGGVDCAGAAEPVPACPPGEDCVDAPRPPEEECVPREYKRCALPPCETDDDCPDDTVCHSEVREQCSAGGSAGCAPGENCPPPEPQEPVCETYMGEPTCTPRWLLPCEEQADCGDGFTCEEVIAGSCSAGTPRTDPAQPQPSDGNGSDGFAPPADGGGSGGAGGGEDPLPDPVCTEEPTGVFYCKPVEVTCEDDSQCPDGWSCQEQPSDDVACGEPAPAPAPTPADDGDSAGNGSSGAPADADARVPAECTPTEPTTPPEKLCQPPYANEFGGIGIGRDAAGSPTGGGLLGEADDGNTAPPASPNPAPENQNAGHEEGASGPESSSCSIAATGDPKSAASLLALLGLSLLLVRRRRAA